MLRRGKALVALPLLAVLAWSAYECQRIARGSLAASAAEGDSTSRALALIPQAAWVHEAAGIAAAREARAADASAHLSAALRMRPTSPGTWAAFAEARYKAGVSDETFGLALLRAAALGPNEPEVQETVAFYALAVFDELGPATRAAVDRIVAAGMRRDPAAMLQIAQRRGRLDVACRHVAVTSRSSGNRAQLCMSTGAI